jgi:hypothetical protein
LYSRRNDIEEVVVAVNGGDGEAALPLPDADRYTPLCIVGNTKKTGCCASDEIHIPAHTALILHRGGGL